MRRWGVSLITTTLIFMCIPLLGLFDEPRLLLSRHWDVYLMFVIAPLILGCALLVISSRRYSGV